MNIIHEPVWIEVGEPDRRGAQTYRCNTCGRRVTAPSNGFPSLAIHTN